MGLGQAAKQHGQARNCMYACCQDLNLYFNIIGVIEVQHNGKGLYHPIMYYSDFYGYILLFLYLLGRRYSTSTKRKIDASELFDDTSDDSEWDL